MEIEVHSSGMFSHVVQEERDLHSESFCEDLLINSKFELSCNVDAHSPLAIVKADNTESFRGRQG